METHLLKNLLEKYKQGNCSPAEVKLVEDWLDAIQNNGAAYPDDFIAAQLGITKSRIDDFISTHHLARKKQFGWLKIAASVLLLALAGAAAIGFYQKKPYCRGLGL